MHGACRGLLVNCGTTSHSPVSYEDRKCHPASMGFCETRKFVVQRNTRLIPTSYGRLFVKRDVRVVEKSGFMWFLGQWFVPMWVEKRYKV